MTQEAEQQASIPLDAVNTNNLVIGVPSVHASFPDEGKYYPPPFDKECLDRWERDNEIAHKFAKDLKELITSHLESWPYARPLSIRISADAEIIKTNTTRTFRTCKSSLTA